jgi:succinate dehydrogenase hydrophobic anchor subunit
MRVFQLQRFSAIALLVFLTIHMVVVHYPPFHIDFSIILERMQDPVWKVIDILFLLSVLVHALTGAYMVITDFESAFNYRKALAWTAVVIGVLAFFSGSATIWAFQLPV